MCEELCEIIVGIFKHWLDIYIAALAFNKGEKLNEKRNNVWKLYETGIFSYKSGSQTTE